MCSQRYRLKPSHKFISGREKGKFFLAISARKKKMNRAEKKKTWRSEK